MSAELWPCSTCGAPGARNIAARGACIAHAVEFYRQLPDHVWQLNGIGLPVAAVDGDGTALLECVACLAGWRAAPFTRCPWCRRACELLIEAQARLVLEPPAIDHDDPRHDVAVAAWVERLVVAVRAELVTEQQARRVLARVGEVADAAA